MVKYLFCFRGPKSTAFTKEGLINFFNFPGKAGLKG